MQRLGFHILVRVFYIEVILVGRNNLKIVAPAQVIKICKSCWIEFHKQCNVSNAGWIEERDFVKIKYLLVLYFSTFLLFLPICRGNCTFVEFLLPICFIPNFKFGLTILPLVSCVSPSGHRKAEVTR